MSHDPNCPLCGSFAWEATQHDVTYCYKGEEFALSGIEYSLCKECGFDLVLPDQSRRNESRIRDKHRGIDGLLTGSEIREIRKSFSLSQQEAARIFGGGDNAFSKYERGEVSQSLAMDRLLRVARTHPYILKTLCALAGQPPPETKLLRGTKLHVTINMEMSYGEPTDWNPKVVKAASNVQEVLDEQIAENDSHLEAA